MTELNYAAPASVEYIPRSQDEVVRYRECRHWESKSVPTRCTEGVGGLKITNDDGSSYCSYGERKARGE